MRTEELTGEPRRTPDEVIARVTESVAREVTARVGYTRRGDGRWVTPDGRMTWSTDEALTWALVRIAEGV
jgi:hypothetical protein